MEDTPSTQPIDTIADVPTQSIDIEKLLADVDSKESDQNSISAPPQNRKQKRAKQRKDEKEQKQALKLKTSRALRAKKRSGPPSALMNRKLVNH